VKTKLENILYSLKKENKSLLAFNLQNFYQLEAASLTSKELQTPLIIQFSERYLRFLDKKYGIKVLYRFRV